MKSSLGRVFILLVLIQCAGIADHSLWTPDEPREAQIVREMSLKGEYLIPSLAGRPFLEKPPLYYGAAIISYTLFKGFYPEAGRLASLIFALATLLAVFFTSRRLFPGNVAVLAPLILATFPLFFLASHKILVDMALVFFVTAAMCSFIIAYGEQSRTWYRLFWISLAGAFLAKGIVGLAIPGMGLLIFMAWQRDLSFLRSAWAVQGILLLTGVMAAWGAVLYLRGGSDYLYTFFVYNQLGRFLPIGGIYEGGHVRPFYFYLISMPVQAAPFFLLLVPALASLRGPEAREKLLWSWLAGGLLILSLASTKREIYLLPVYPAMAMIIALWLDRFSPVRARPWEKVLVRALLAIILLAAAGIPIGYVVKLEGSIPVALLVSLVLAGLFLLLWRRYQGSLPLFMALSWSLVFILWTPVIFPQVDKGKSYRQVFEDMGRIVSREQVIGYRLTETVEALGPFYGQFPVKSIEDRAAFVRALDNHETNFIIVLPSRLDKGLKKGLSSRARPVYEGGGRMRREIDLWKMRSYP